MPVLQCFLVLLWVWAVVWAFTGSFKAFPRFLVRVMSGIGAFMLIMMFLAIAATLPNPGSYPAERRKEAS